MNKGTVDKHYQKINAQTGVVDADPHRLIQMLYAGAIEQIAIAKGCIQRNEVDGKGLAIGKAISIVGGLNEAVNPDIDAGQLTDNLTSLYEFVTQRLTDANLNNNTSSLDEAVNVLKELQTGWNAIRAEALNASPAPIPA